MQKELLRKLRKCDPKELLCWLSSCQAPSVNRERIAIIEYAIAVVLSLGYRKTRTASKNIKLQSSNHLIESLFMAYSEPSPNPKPSLRKYKKPIMVGFAVIIAAVILVAPIIPIQYTVTKTRNRNLRYSAKVYSETVFGVSVPRYIEVKNTDSISGSFSVTVNKWLGNPFDETKRLEDTFSQSSFINAGATQTFNIPNWNWNILGMNSYTYSVSAPSIQETYNVQETEYKSILNLLGV